MRVSPLEGTEEKGKGSFEKTPPPYTPTRNVGAFRLRTPSRHCDSRPLWGRQSCRFLETGSLHLPLAALRLFPPPPLTTQREGAAAPPLWIPHPRPDKSGSAQRSGCARRRVSEPTAAKRRLLGGDKCGARGTDLALTTPKAAPTPSNAAAGYLCSTCVGRTR